MGIFGRIRAFFASCIRPTTSSSSNNGENRRLFEPTVDSLQGNDSRQSSAVASTSSKVGSNYDAIKNTLSSTESNSSCPQRTVIKASTSRHESARASQLNIKPRYFLHTFISCLNPSPKGERVTLASDVIYLNEWTVCKAIILDECSYQLSSQHTVELTSDSRVEFRDCEQQNGYLQFNVKALNPDIITIYFNIQKYPDINSFTLSKKVHVKHDPCSAPQADMTIKRIDESSGNECVFQVSIVDILGILSSHELCELDAFAPGENEIVQKQMHSEAGHICFDITVRGERPWSRDFVAILNGNPIPNAEKIEVFDTLRGLCYSALKDNDYQSIPDFIEFYGSRIFIPLTTGDDDGKFVPYDEDNCQLLRGDANIPILLCKNVTADDLFEPGSAHRNNIRRVFELSDHRDIHGIPGEKSVIIDLSNVHYRRHSVCKQIIQHLLCGLYYRQKASQAAEVRMEWKKRITTLVKLSRKSVSLRLCKFFRDHFGSLMNRYNREACDELFKFFNFQRDANVVDLHGLYVADEKKLELLRLDLLRGLVKDEQINKIFQQCKLKSFNGRSEQVLKNELVNGTFPAYEINDFVKFCRNNGVNQKKLNNLERDLLAQSERSKEVDDLVQKFRLEGDEAIRKLNETLDRFDLEEAIKNNTPWLEIIVGAGRHSRIKNEQNIRPKVEKLLEERNLKFAAVNKGALVVTLLTYSGPEPCFAEYYCEKCDRSWKSNKSYVGKYQQCFQCRVNCWPIKLQKAKRKSTNKTEEKVIKYPRECASQASLTGTRYRDLGRPCNASQEECVII